MQLDLGSTEGTPSEAVARPFLKWAGGKGQLLETIQQNLPRGFHTGAIRRYVEPFVGGGAVLFHLTQQKSGIRALHVSDINEDLTLAYEAIKRDVEGLIAILQELQDRYYALDKTKRAAFYYETRARFNDQLKSVDFSTYHQDWVERTALLILMNRTCFNGLFRVNSKGEFNVPFGRYGRPTICGADNLRAVARILQNVQIERGDFPLYEPLIDDETLVYFDPPYRPISATASFNAYAKDSFDDAEQLRLAEFYRLLDGKGAKLMLSNSDPKNIDPDDNFFDDAYREFRIERIQARRSINRDADGRGHVNELLIMNY